MANNPGPTTSPPWSGPGDRPWRRLYHTARWRKGRALFLAEHPLCEYCRRQGRTTAAAVVDHIKAHKGNEQLFFDVTNWQALCRDCHDRVKQGEEHGRLMPGAGLDGLPIDASHPWNAGPGGGGSKV
jgi:Restriction endonuclease